MLLPVYEKSKTRKAVFRMLITVFVIAFAVCLILGKLLFSYKPAFIFNRTFFIVGSSSMEPEFPVHTLIIVKNEPFSRLKAGDVIVYRSDALSGGLAFHRVVRITEDGLYTKGDQNELEDNQIIVEKNYIGKGVSKNYAVGRYLFIIGSLPGFIIFLLLPLAAVWLLFKTGVKAATLLKSDNG